VRDGINDTALGIDACKAGWFFFRRDGATTTFGVAETVREICQSLPESTTVLIDIPIGLRQRGKKERRCDVEARAVLGPRRSSVFAAPCRPVLTAKNYQQALERNRRNTGRGLSRQSWNLVPKIREVDQLLRAEAAFRKILREAHPELCLWGLAGGPMPDNKKTRDGFAQRMTILSILDQDAEALIAAAWLAHGGWDADRDDLVDAFVLMLCASHGSRLRSIPAEPETDPQDLPMEMVYLPGLEIPGVS
jgi:predicted RNase H-like nuclease